MEIILMLDGFRIIYIQEDKMETIEKAFTELSDKKDITVNKKNMKDFASRTGITQLVSLMLTKK